MRQLKRTLLLFLITFLPFYTLAKKAISKPVIIAYVGGYKGLVNTSKIQASKITHINYAFVNIKNGKAFLDNEKTDTINFKNLNALKAVNPELKILISIGGWSWSENFSDAVLTDSSRVVFAKTAVDIVRKYKLDGVDIDWEYPGMQGEARNIYRPDDKQNFTLMFEALRTELNLLEKQTAKRKLLTTAVGGFPSFLDHTQMDKAAKYLDFINLMTYDFYSSEFAGHHTNLFASKLYSSDNNADKTVKAFIQTGVPVKKLVMGIAFYGRNFSVAPDNETGIGAKIISQSFGDGYTVIKDSLVNKKGFKEFWDNDAKAPYLFNATTHQFITYDNELSVQHKCNYVKDNEMAGVMFWEYDSDEKGYLLKEINRVLR